MNAEVLPRGLFASHPRAAGGLFTGVSMLSSSRNISALEETDVNGREFAGNAGACEIFPGESARKSFLRSPLKLRMIPASLHPDCPYCEIRAQR